MLKRYKFLLSLKIFPFPIFLQHATNIMTEILNVIFDHTFREKEGVTYIIYLKFRGFC